MQTYLYPDSVIKRFQLLRFVETKCEFSLLKLLQLHASVLCISLIEGLEKSCMGRAMFDEIAHSQVDRASQTGTCVD